MQARVYYQPNQAIAELGDRAMIDDTKNQQPEEERAVGYSLLAA